MFVRALLHHQGAPAPPAHLAARLDVLASRCERAGTDVNRIRKSILWTGPIDPTGQGGADLTAHLAGYAAIWSPKSPSFR